MERSIFDILEVFGPEGIARLGVVALLGLFSAVLIVVFRGKKQKEAAKTLGLLVGFAVANGLGVGSILLIRTFEVLPVGGNGDGQAVLLSDMGYISRFMQLFFSLAGILSLVFLVWFLIRLIVPKPTPPAE